MRTEDLRRAAVGEHGEEGLCWRGIQHVPSLHTQDDPLLGSQVQVEGDDIVAPLGHLVEREVHLAQERGLVDVADHLQAHLPVFGALVLERLLVTLIAADLLPQQDGAVIVGEGPVHDLIDRPIRIVGVDARAAGGGTAARVQDDAVLVRVEA